MTAVVSLEDVGQAYPVRHGRRWVLRRVDWTIREGERWGVLGRNGNGKSCLLRLISGAEIPAAGRVVHHGRVSWPLAFGGGFQGGLSGADNIRFIARVYGVDERTAVEQARAFAEIGRAFTEPFMTYSSGMRARLAFAASLLVRFDCLLIDEIISVGDVAFQEKCRAAFKALPPETAMVIVSHDMHVIRETCNKVATLIDGKIRFHDSVEDGIAAYHAMMFAADECVARATA